MIDLSHMQVKLSYFKTNLVMAALTPLYFQFSSFPDCPLKLFRFSLFSRKNFEHNILARNHSREPRESTFLFQKLSIAVQRGNCAALHSTFGEFFF